MLSLQRQQQPAAAMWRMPPRRFGVAPHGVKPAMTPAGDGPGQRLAAGWQSHEGRRPSAAARRRTARPSATRATCLPANATDRAATVLRRHHQPVRAPTTISRCARPCGIAGGQLRSARARVHQLRIRGEAGVLNGNEGDGRRRETPFVTGTSGVLRRGVCRILAARSRSSCQPNEPSSTDAVSREMHAEARSHRIRGAVCLKTMNDHRVLRTISGDNVCHVINTS